MFYEHIHSAEEDYLHIPDQPYTDFAFPLHLHKNVEFVYVEEGALQVRIGGTELTVGAGEGALILPGQPHAFATPEHSVCWPLIFSADYLPELRRVERMLYPVIRPGIADLHRRLCACRGNRFRVKSLLYALAACYGEGAPIQTPPADDSLSCRIVSYLDTHYSEPITLRRMAETFGYNYRYLSGVVNRLYGMPFPQVVHRYRVDHACQLLRTTDRSVTEIAQRCGFDTLRSFNRCFKEQMGTTPREYRKST
ncbi:MAG: AraC family transcriptional regulator [Clostridia bacterium]|nr:AraC family transcriptional regulator [Clostridia bacterium]